MVESNHCDLVWDYPSAFELHSTKSYVVFEHETGHNTHSLSI